MKENTEFVTNMEFVIEELHKEWNKSGVVYDVAVLGAKEKTMVEQAIATRVKNQQDIVENEDISFIECIQLTHENFILLRLARKIKVKGQKNNGRKKLSVYLDKEEFDLYERIIGEA